MNDLPVGYRRALPNDTGFIIATWTQHHHKVHPNNFVPNSLYFPAQTARIHKLLASSIVMVSHIDDEPDNLIGYIVATPKSAQTILIHWIHVKGIYRRMGLGKGLLSVFEPEGKTLVCSHFFDLFPKLRDRYNLIFDPTTLDTL